MFLQLVDNLQYELEKKYETWRKQVRAGVVTEDELMEKPGPKDEVREAKIMCSSSFKIYWCDRQKMTLSKEEDGDSDNTEADDDDGGDRAVPSKAQKGSRAKKVKPRDGTSSTLARPACYTRQRNHSPSAQ
jgi:hypothetical protein